MVQWVNILWFSWGKAEGQQKAVSTLATLILVKAISKCVTANRSGIASWHDVNITETDLTYLP